MTGRSPRRRVDGLYGRGRLWIAKLLREVLQNTLPYAQERRYRRILGFKDEVQYGAKVSPIEEAARLTADLESFARWTEDLL